MAKYNVLFLGTIVTYIILNDFKQEIKLNY